MALLYYTLYSTVLMVSIYLYINTYAYTYICVCVNICIYIYTHTRAYIAAIRTISSKGSGPPAKIIISAPYSDFR